MMKAFFFLTILVSGCSMGTQHGTGGQHATGAAEAVFVRSPGDVWERNAGSLLTNFNNMYGPCVVETPGAYRYRMWFFGWAAGHANPGVPGCDAIFYARSKDLLHWEVYSRRNTWDTTMNPSRWTAVLHASRKWYEAWHVGDPSVVLQDGRFYMAYSATSKHLGNVPGYPGGGVACVMGAVSDDGVHWTRTAAPLLIRKGDTKRLKPEPGRIGDFHRPCLRWQDDRWKLWFDYWHPDKGVCMGYAENVGDFMQQGGFQIKHDLKSPLLQHWPNPEVIKIGEVYHCFSDPPGYPIEEGQSGWKSRQLREAVSDDGLLWRRLDFIAPDPDTDACHVPQALVTEVDGRTWLYLFYSTQIGYSRDDGQYHYEYDRIRAMRRLIGDAEPNVPPGP